jgi:catechol 2,3-dioxygenase-like lactoylglutathione lyase family enzyme
MLATETAVKFQVRLNVTDLDRAVRFYRALLDAEPTYTGGDQVRFELEQPPLVLGLVRAPQVSGGSLNHVGFRMADSAALVELQRRLEEAGFPTQTQEGVECCYARQTKFWVTDPDRHLWEMYVFEEDIDHSGFEDAPAPAPVVKAPVLWEHRLTDPVPERIPAADGSVDEVRLTGSFNARPDELRAEMFLPEVFRVLRPGGKVMIHGLASEAPLTGPLTLPGLAALVRHVPVADDVVETLRRAGFTGMSFETFAASCCLPATAGVLREMKLIAQRPGTGESSLNRSVLYKGPLDSVRDDAGTLYSRGEKVTVSADVYQQLREGPAAGQFLFFPI